LVRPGEEQDAAGAGSIADGDAIRAEFDPLRQLLGDEGSASSNQGWPTVLPGAGGIAHVNAAAGCHLGEGSSAPRQSVSLGSRGTRLDHLGRSGDRRRFVELRTECWGGKISRAEHRGDNCQDGNNSSVGAAHLSLLNSNTAPTSLSGDGGYGSGQPIVSAQ
jgi:hypothetical protein